MMTGTVNREDCCDVRHLDSEQIISLMQCGALEDCHQAVDRYLTQIRFRELESLMLRLYIGMDLYLSAQRFAADVGVSGTEFAGCFGTIDSLSEQLRTTDGTTSLLHDMVEQCIRWRIAHAAESGNNIVAKAKAFICENYMHDDLSLPQIADAVGLSPSYLSAVFKREAKQNLSDYLTKVRIQHAKELLCCSARMIYEVAYEVGFRDYRYFSQIFKKHTGKTPREFQTAANRKS
ncbi:MAG: helix-turn-helix domain-containing protein [Oscillospiraceae bacterium]|nr:helix-turn-helix domain-containing protein [Oscillospiraceae bacterium]